MCFGDVFSPYIKSIAIALSVSGAFVSTFFAIMISATELKSVDLYRLESLCSSFLFQLTSERAEAESLFSVTELEFVVLTVKLFV